MPTCTQCRTDHAKEFFVTAREKPAKTCAYCRAKGAAKFKKHYAKNAKKVIKRTRKWKTTNPEGYKAAKREAKKRYFKKNPQAKARSNRRYQQKYPEKNAAKVVAYQARKLRATPKWADESEIARIYALARQQTKLSGQKVTVDHIVPLRSDLVCGLHCTANLRLVVHGYNSRKSNKTWPDMPEPERGFKPAAIPANRD